MHVARCGVTCRAAGHSSGSKWRDCGSAPARAAQRVHGHRSPTPGPRALSAGTSVPVLGPCPQRTTDRGQEDSPRSSEVSGMASTVACCSQLPSRAGVRRGTFLSQEQAGHHPDLTLVHSDLAPCASWGSASVGPAPTCVSWTQGGLWTGASVAANPCPPPGRPRHGLTALGTTGSPSQHTNTGPPTPIPPASGNDLGSHGSQCVGLRDSGHNLGEGPEYPGKEKGEQNFRSLTFSICEVGCQSDWGVIDARLTLMKTTHPSVRSHGPRSQCGELTNTLY